MRFGRCLPVRSEPCDGYRIRDNFLERFPRLVVVKPMLELTQTVGKIVETAIEDLFLGLPSLRQGSEQRGFPCSRRAEENDVEGAVVP